MLCYPIKREKGKKLGRMFVRAGKGKNSRLARIYCVLGSVLELPKPAPTPGPALLQASKLKFRELCNLPNFIQLVNAGDLNLGLSPKSKLLPPRNKVRDLWKHGDLRKTGEAGGFHQLSGKVCSFPGSHAGRVTLIHKKTQ